MDLDEFLMENGISTTLEEELQRSVSDEEEEEEEEEAPRTGSALRPASELEEPEGEEERGKSDPHSQEPEPVLSPSCPSPVDPDRVEVQVDFQPDPADLVLSTVPGGELFNPRVHRFSEDELKPQPMIKKAKKVFVPEEKKDDKYWSRRSKNNVAAKRSRDARRLKENQITVRAAFLEKENAALRAEGGGAAEGLRALQERARQVPGQIRTAVRTGSGRYTHTGPL
ncbi:thyrotroph embryonic factor-like [Acipenser ruthenus]|uniref:thyrotroph embryonic factor-like n=1 Tax=Acipenser ruthenus TaxID=7906 RepID=UPI0027418368|nr:thyrotroph embryonic factor-like [Acipenser ruthenus]